MQIPLEKLPQTPKLIKDYLDQNPKVKPYYNKSFSPENVLLQAREKSKNYQNRAILCDELDKQMSALDLSESQQENLKSLKQDNCFTITTGHQLNLFTGPLYFIYKISQVIKTAVELSKKQKEYKFVPVFWMASEDHDFEEINHCYLNGKKIQWNTDQTGAVGRFTLKGIDEVIKEFLKDLKHTEHYSEIEEMISHCYIENYTLAQATKLIVHTLFKDKGILILDGDNKALKKLMIPYFKDELLNESLFEETKETIQNLESDGYKIQVNPRKINLFYLTEHHRNRIIKKGEVYKIKDQSKEFTQEEILEGLEQHPQRFSPNAVMRPLYQEVILPNVAYIGGNAEVAYWLELKNYFDSSKVPFPILIPRNSILYLSKNQGQKLNKLQLQKEDLTDSLLGLEEKILQNFSTLDLDMEEKVKQLEQIYNDLKDKSKATDKTLENLLNAELQKQLNSFKKVEKRLKKAEKKILNDKITQLHHLYESVYPGGVFQERRENLFQYYQYYGKEFLANIYNTISYAQSSLNIVDI